MKKNPLRRVFFRLDNLLRQDVGNNVLRNPDKLRRTRRQVEDSTPVRQDAGNNVLRSWSSVALEVAEAEADQ